MPFYKYKAMTSEGKIVKGTSSASSEAELESKLRQSHLDLISAQVANSNFVNFFKTIELKELILICIHFHHLEQAGVPLLDSIGDLRDISENKIVKEIMVDIYDALKTGKSFSNALAQHPQIFDNVFISLIEAGEKTGAFADVFDHLEHHFKWIAELRQKIKKAVTYPIFLLVLMFGVIGLMMTFVIPKLSVFLLTLNIPLPLYTRILMVSSDFVAKFWPALLISPLVIYGLIRLFSSISYSFAYRMDFFKLKIPVIGSIIKKIEISRFCHFFAITYKSGIKILDCIEISKKVVNNLVIREAIEEIKSEVTTGKNLTEALQQSNQFPLMVIRMFRIGEESGNIDQSLKHITTFYDNEVNVSIDNLVGVLQPALTIVMGGLMFWITLAVFGPVYSNFGNITNTGNPTQFGAK